MTARLIVEKHYLYEFDFESFKIFFKDAYENDISLGYSDQEFIERTYSMIPTGFFESAFGKPIKVDLETDAYLYEK